MQESEKRLARVRQLWERRKKVEKTLHEEVIWKLNLESQVQFLSWDQYKKLEVPL